MTNRRHRGIPPKEPPPIQMQVIKEISSDDSKYLEDCGIEVLEIGHKDLANTLWVAHVADFEKLCTEVIARGKIVDMVRKLNRHA